MEQHKTAALAHSTGHNGNGSALAETKPKRNRMHQRDQAAFIQRFVFDSISALKRNCTKAETGELVMDVKTAVVVHKLVGAWDTVADRTRILRGKGLPASVKSKAAKSSAAIVQPL